LTFFYVRCHCALNFHNVFVAGLWYGIGGVLVLLYALHNSQSDRLLEELCRVAVVLGGVGAVVMVMQPQFAISL
jgi:hypothetical protein